MMRMTSAALLGLAAVVALSGCARPPMVEFTAPKVMMHVEGKITNLEAIRGEPKIERIDPAMYRVHGTGEVRINDYHLVEVHAGKIRVHGMDVESRGAMRNVFVEQDKVVDGVHPDRVSK